MRSKKDNQGNKPTQLPVEPSRDDTRREHPESDTKTPRGERSEGVKAAEKHPDEAEKTNPVGEATQWESKDPYAEGQHIKNPEDDSETDEARQAKQNDEVESMDEDTQAQVVHDQTALDNDATNKNR